MPSSVLISGASRGVGLATARALAARGYRVFAGVRAAGEACFRELLEVNLLGAWRLTRAVLPDMRARGSGHVLMISSLSGLVGLPADGQYAASKFALDASSVSWWMRGEEPE